MRLAVPVPGVSAMKSGDSQERRPQSAVRNG